MLLEIRGKAAKKNIFSFIKCEKCGLEGTHLQLKWKQKKIMTRKRGGSGIVIHLSRAHEKKSLSNKQVEGRSAVQADAVPPGPYLIND